MSVAEIGWTLGWNGGELPVYTDGKPNPAYRLPPDNARTPQRLAALARRLDERFSHEIAIGLPQTGGFVHHSTILWAWIRGSEQVRRAVDFGRIVRAPSIALRMGSSSERLLIWALRHPLPYSSVTAHNERLSYALHAPRTRCKPESLRVPLPETFLRIGRQRPVPILLTRCEPTDFALGELTGRLKDPPSRDAWRGRKA